MTLRPRLPSKRILAMALVPWEIGGVLRVLPALPLLITEWALIAHQWAAMSDRLTASLVRLAMILAHRLAQ